MNTKLTFFDKDNLDDTRACKQLRDIQASISQLLVQNYIEHKNKQNNPEQQYYYYGEIINDMDILTSKLEKNAYKIKDNRYEYIANLIQNIRYDYHESIEIKNVKIKYTNFEHLCQLAGKAKYPPHTLLRLIFVPSYTDEEMDDLIYDYKKDYIRIRDLIFNDENYILIINEILNHYANYSTKDIMDVFYSLEDGLKQNEYKDINKKEKYINYYETLKHNFGIIKIQFKTLDKLKKIPMDMKILTNYMYQ